MSTTTESTPASANGNSSVQRVLSIPVVADTLSTVHSTLQNNAYSAAVYGKAEGAAQYLYEQSKPLQEKLAGPIGSVDAVANKGLDFVQARAPFVFETKTDELISKARQPADQAYAYGKTYKDAASARLAPITEQFQTRLAQSQASLASLQEKLSATVAGLPRDAKGAQDQLKSLSEQLVTEMEKVSSFVQDKRKELPQQAQNAVAPLVEKLQTSYTDIRAELTKADTPIATRASNILKYSREQASPIVHEALEAIRKVIGKAEKKSENVSEKTGQVVEDAGKKVEDGKSQVKSQFNGNGSS